MFLAVKTLRFQPEKFNSPKLQVLFRVTSLKRAPPLHYKKPLLAGWNVACEPPLPSGEVARSHAWAARRECEGRFLARFLEARSLAIIGKLARRLGEKEAQDTLTNDVTAKLHLLSTLKRHVNKSITQHMIYLNKLLPSFALQYFVERTISKRS